MHADPDKNGEWTIRGSDHPETKIHNPIDNKITKSYSIEATYNMPKVNKIMAIDETYAN
jgi:hypothetical protein